MSDSPEIYPNSDPRAYGYKDRRPAPTTEVYARAVDWAIGELTDKPSPVLGAAGTPLSTLRALSGALHGQPSGFTWEDVDLLRAADVMVDRKQLDPEGERLANLADRITALLPPRER